MKPFCFSLFIEHADAYLTDKKSMWFNQEDKLIDSSCDINKCIEKLSNANIIALPHDELAVWKPKLFFLSEAIQPSAFIFAGTDISFTNEDLEDLLEAFPSTIFFLTNFLGNHPRCFILPLGNVFYEEFSEEKKNIVCITYCRPNSKNRLDFFEFLQKNTQFESLCVPELPLRDYNILLAKSFFSVCCCGNGYDTFRFWESLSQRSIPIVKNNIFFEALKRQYPQLPFVSIDDWKDLNTLLPTLTPELYNKICKESDFSLAFEPVWVSKLSELAGTP